MLLMLLQRLQEESRDKKSSENSLEGGQLVCQSNTTKLRLDHMKRFGVFALKMRDVVWSESTKDVAEVMNVKESDIVKTWFYDDDNDLHCPKFLVFIDHETKSIVLGIRGTWSLRDALMDVVSLSAISFTALITLL